MGRAPSSLVRLGALRAAGLEPRLEVVGEVAEGPLAALVRHRAVDDQGALAPTPHNGSVEEEVQA